MWENGNDWIDMVKMQACHDRAKYVRKPILHFPNDFRMELVQHAALVTVICTVYIIRFVSFSEKGTALLQARMPTFRSSQAARLRS